MFGKKWKTKVQDGAKWFFLHATQGLVHGYDNILMRNHHYNCNSSGIIPGIIGCFPFGGQSKVIGRLFNSK